MYSNSNSVEKKVVLLPPTELVYDDATIEIHLVQTEDLLYCRWKKKLLQVEYKVGLCRIFEMVKAKRIKYWISNCSEMGDVVQHCQQWTLDLWEDYNAELFGVRTATVVKSDSEANTPTRELLSKCADIRYDMAENTAIFESMVIALDWLFGAEVQFADCERESCNC